MKIEKFLRMIDITNIGKVTIWSDESDLEPLWEGGDAFEIPWWIAKLKIGFKDAEDAKYDEPVRTYIYKNEYDVSLIGLVINVIE